MKRIFLGLFLCLLVSLAYAKRAENPIGWAVSDTLPAQASPNQSYAFVYVFTSNLPFTMPTPLYISTNPSSSEFTVVDNCSGNKLSPRATCTVSVVLIPKTDGTKSFAISMEYGKNKIVLPTQTTQVGASTSQILGIASVPFPTSILSNTTYPLSFTFTNNGSTIANNVNVTANSTNSAGFTISNNGCGSTLTAGASCVVSGTFSTSATSGSVKVGLTLSSSVGNASVTTSSVVNNSTGAEVRTFTFVNKCSFAVSFGFNGGAIPNSPSCSSDTQCPHGTHCRQSTSLCYFANPTPSNGQYSLAASGGTNTVYITDYPNLLYVWSGGIAGRTGCPATGACATADCGSNGANNACPVGQGFSNPATLAELTLQATATDTYDITAINGVNIGVSMGPTGNNPSSTQPYFCGNPGSNVANNSSMGNCDWNLSSYVPSPASTYTYVTDTTGHACSSTAADCTGYAGTVCGLSFNASANTLTKKCGTQLGFLNANQICSFAHTNFNYPNNGENPGDTYFNCDNQITSTTPASLTPYSYLAMYACETPNASQSTLNSCYKSYGSTVDDCCGCVDWWTVPGVNVPAASTQSCNGNGSTFWTSNVKDTISWLKKACPTMYTYQYDDASSKFTCNNIGSSGKNTVNYTITFCPS